MRKIRPEMVEIQQSQCPSDQNPEIVNTGETMLPTEERSIAHRRHDVFRERWVVHG